MPYVWNAAQARYRDVTTGRFVSRTTVLGFLRESTLQASNQVRLLGERVASGEISVPVWTETFRKEIQGEFIRQYLTGRGGVSSMTQSDWGRVGRMLRDQYAYANNFAEELPNLSAAQIASRSELYMRAANSAFYVAERVGMRAAGKTEERWVLGDTEHCADCEELASRGWVKIGELGTVPRAGMTACLVNCGCSIAYR